MRTNTCSRVLCLPGFIFFYLHDGDSKNGPTWGCWMPKFGTKPFETIIAKLTFYLVESFVILLNDCKSFHGFSNEIICSFLRWVRKCANFHDQSNRRRVMCVFVRLLQRQFYYLKQAALCILVLGLVDLLGMKMQNVNDRSNDNHSHMHLVHSVYCQWTRY
jgi:hypothetical protein